METIPANCKILIATDSSIETDELKNHLLNSGYAVHATRDGKSALEAFNKYQPNLVIMSDELPIYDGMELAEKIRSLIVDQKFVPFIMLSHSGDGPLIYELEAFHIDEHFSVPFEIESIIFKINSLIRYQTQINSIAHKYQRLNKQYHKLQYEYDSAERCFLKIRPGQHIFYDDIKYHMSPQSLANGDVFLYEKSPTGERYFILADFTGHGLSAAISACSIKELFEVMVKDSLQLNMIVNEINDLLIDILPPEIFASACAIKIDAENTFVELWNGGLPTVYLYNTDKIKHSFEPQFPSLGIEILSDDELETVKVPIARNDRIFLTTDGLLEARNKYNDMFGKVRYMNCIEGNIKTDKVFTSITNEIHTHLKGVVQGDDLTYVEILC